MSGGRNAGVALLGLAAVLFTVAVVSGWNGARNFSGRETAARDIEAAATAFVVAYGTFDFRDAGTYPTRLGALSTGPLRDALRHAVVDQGAARQQRSVVTRVEAASVTSFSDTGATAVVTSVQERRWVDPVVGQSMQQAVRQRVTCRLVREDGTWLVAELWLESEEPARWEAR